MEVDAKLVVASGHVATKLSPADRTDLASITKHPGLEVLIAKILEPHAKKQLELVHTVKLDDPNRTIKIEAICSVAQAFRLCVEITKMEILHNWKTLEDAELARTREAAEAATKNERKTQ